ncbi:MAG: MotA/TolQ/ExbB proton channel family protein [Kangiellaceae bacterium]|nr:MotA/TolQ/ExbB proton channel family protein [Kangiellaceae bacterium]MCW9000470.1 MotA/TolQ/ExbB proton channel family protein [Kangiellaceae bacterium]MCW9016232.1 MotA/TolQ/ExbB proton channel family protein [Kangiellaceae bacterium]
MDYGNFLGVLHQLVGWLLYPVIVGLVIALVITIWEVGLSIAERFVSLRTFIVDDIERQKMRRHFKVYATRRLERADLLARAGPILGLMGTLIPLGPGLTALGSGNIDILATALTVAFDTTVVGLLIGLLAYVLGRIRRRWYESVWEQLSEESSVSYEGVNNPKRTIDQKGRLIKKGD